MKLKDKTTDALELRANTVPSHTNGISENRAPITTRSGVALTKFI